MTRFTQETILSNDASPFEVKRDDTTIPAHLTMADWKMACGAINNCHKLLTILVKDMDTMEQENTALKKAIEAQEKA